MKMYSGSRPFTDAGCRMAVFSGVAFSGLDTCFPALWKEPTVDKVQAGPRWQQNLDGGLRYSGDTHRNEDSVDQVLRDPGNF